MTCTPSATCTTPFAPVFAFQSLSGITSPLSFTLTRSLVKQASKRLQLIKKPARCYDDSSLMNVSARQLSENTLVIALFASGESSLVITAANMAKSRGATIVSITSLGSNTLSEVADINVYVKSTYFSKADIKLCSRVQLLILCEYIFFRYLEWT